MTDEITQDVGRPLLPGETTHAPFPNNPTRTACGQAISSRVAMATITIPTCPACVAYFETYDENTTDGPAQIVVTNVLVEGEAAQVLSDGDPV